jgi:polysaccharide deacetylase 2 family uncharacterized protein YibQ
VPALLALLGILAAAPVVADGPRVTVIIDDLGYSLDAGLRTVGLPGPVVCAILPQTPRSMLLGELANDRGKEVLLHLPLEALDPTVAGEPGLIRLDSTRRALGETFSENLASVPFAIGVNGHRGSLVTRHPGHMTWLMEEVASRNLLFVDSYTTHHSVALQMAREAGVPSTRRHVFLDSDPAPAAIEREFERLLVLARRRGSAVAIGHPYPETLELLERRLPGLSDEGVTLVGIRELIGTTAITAPRPARGQDEPRVAGCGASASAGGKRIEPACRETF